MEKSLGIALFGGILRLCQGIFTTVGKTFENIMFFYIISSQHDQINSTSTLIIRGISDYSCRRKKV